MHNVTILSLPISVASMALPLPSLLASVLLVTLGMEPIVQVFLINTVYTRLIHSW